MATLRPWLAWGILPLVLMALWEPLLLACLELFNYLNIAPVMTLVVILAVYSATVETYGGRKLKFRMLTLVVSLALSVITTLVILGGDWLGVGQVMVEYPLPLRLLFVFGFLWAFWFSIYSGSCAFMDKVLFLSYTAIGFLLLTMVVFLSGKPMITYGLIFAAGGLSLAGCIQLISYDHKHISGVGVSFLWTIGLAMVILLGAWHFSGIWRLPSLGLENSLIDNFKLPGNISGSATSYNYLTAFEVGGDISPNDRLFMTVQSPVPSYWRGESFDFYDNRGWKKDLGESVQKGNFEPLVSPQGEGRLVEQVFTLANNVSSNIVFTGYQPMMLTLPTNYFLSDEALNLYLEQPFFDNTTYRVTTKVPAYRAQDLRKALKPYSLYTLQAYLQLPEEVPQRVRELAQNLTEGKKNPYDKAKAIEKYLRDKYPYTLSTEKTPAGRDMVDYFLFDLRKGYCTYHASAMTVMMRSLGYPARWVTGFTTGTWNDEIQAFEVRNSDAHAWVEVYFEGYGWVPFEPTSSFAYPGEEKIDQSVNNEAEKKEEYIWVEDPQAGSVSQTSWNNQIWRWLAGAFLFIIGLWLAGKVVLVRKKEDLRKNYSPVQKVYHRMIMALRAKGYPKQGSQTPREYALRLGEELPQSAGAIGRLTEEYLLSRYGGHSHSQDELQDLELAVVDLEKDLR
ncbi:MAG: transglutaminaseTgpA domain-containing protein [Clostridia bacterium]|nr:transglutaminaseTgpA domain-containing protein [Clostridia bacterium]